LINNLVPFEGIMLSLLAGSWQSLYAYQLFWCKLLIMETIYGYHIGLIQQQKAVRQW